MVIVNQIEGQPPYVEQWQVSNSRICFFGLYKLDDAKQDQYTIAIWRIKWKI